MKNRIVGILVLLLIAVVGWPLLFEDDISEPIDITPQITEISTKVESFELEKPQQDLFSEPDIAATDKALAGNSTPKPLAEDKKAPSYANIKDLSNESQDAKRGALDKDGSALSWTLQLASFVELDRAEELVGQLQAKGHRAYLKKADTSKGERVRVFSGPSLDKAELEKTQKTIDETFKLKSMLLRFRPDQ